MGCHKKHPVYSPDGATPFGGLANAELRDLRSQVHVKLDPRWKNTPAKNYGEKRKQVYEWLARRMMIPPDKCHIALFRETDCRDALRILSTPDETMHMQRAQDNKHPGKVQCPFCGRYFKEEGLSQHQRNSEKCRRNV